MSLNCSARRQALVTLRTKTNATHRCLRSLSSSATKDLTTGRQNGKRKERVVILGSGWAGYALARTLDPAKFDRVVVSPRSHFVFTPLLASTAVGTLEFRAVAEPVRRIRQVIFHQGWADDVDFTRKVVRVEASIDDDAASHTTIPAPEPATIPGSAVIPTTPHKGPMIDVPYDKLVVAVGAYSQTFNITGVREHAHFLRDVGDARRIRLRILTLFEHCASNPTISDEQKRELLHFAVVGGGPTGIEFAAELHDLIYEDLIKVYPGLVPLVRITVYDIAPAVLPMFDRELADYAMELFNRRGIEIRTEHHLQAIRAEGEGLKLKIKEHGDQEVGAGMVVWSTGLMQHPLVKKLTNNQVRGRDSNSNSPLRLRSDPKTGAIVTDGHMRAQLTENASGEKSSRMDDVFVIGDCAFCEADQSLPKTGQVASQQAVYLAKAMNKGNIAESKPFSFRNWGTMAYLGGWRAIHQSSADELRGRAAWVLWRTAYLTKSLSVRNKIVVPFFWFISWLFGRDISRF
ncbi:hypothetical protein MCOR25_009255 [Pyricularia grisea]|nr:hypothetical protein MCOR25_009255 [Pyricularia grisea]